MAATLSEGVLTAPKLLRDLSIAEAEAIAGGRITAAELAARFVLVRFDQVDTEHRVVMPLRVLLPQREGRSAAEYLEEARVRALLAVRGLLETGVERERERLDEEDDAT